MVMLKLMVDIVDNLWVKLWCIVSIDLVTLYTSSYTISIFDRIHIGLGLCWDYNVLPHLN